MDDCLLWGVFPEKLLGNRISTTAMTVPISFVSSTGISSNIAPNKSPDSLLVSSVLIGGAVISRKSASIVIDPAGEWPLSIVTGVDWSSNDDDGRGTEELIEVEASS